jgi:hypothetical protein
MNKRLNFGKHQPGRGEREGCELAPVELLAANAKQGR